MSRPTRDSAAARALYARVDGRATGKLAVGAGAVEVAVHLLNGEIIGATSADDLRQVIRLLVATGAVEAGAAEAYEALVDEGGDVFGALLVLGQTFDKALSDRFRQNLSDYLSSVSAPRFFEQKTVFVSNLQMGHDSRSLVDELCVVCDLAKAVDVDNLVVRGPTDPGPDALRQTIAKLVGNEPRTISSLLHEIPAEPMRARVAIGAMLQSRVLAPPGLASLGQASLASLGQASLASLGQASLQTEARGNGTSGKEDISGEDLELLAVASALDEDDTISEEQARSVTRLSGSGTPVPATRAHSASGHTPASGHAPPRTPGAPPQRDAGPSSSSAGSRSRAKPISLPAGRPPRPEIVRADVRSLSSFEEGRDLPDTTGRPEPSRASDSSRAGVGGLGGLPFEGSAEFTRAIPELADFEIRTEEPTPGPAQSLGMDSGRADPSRAEPGRGDPRTGEIFDRRSHRAGGHSAGGHSAGGHSPSGHSASGHSASGHSAGGHSPSGYGLGSSFSARDEDEDVEDARTEQVDRRVYASNGSLSDWLNRTDAVVEDDLFSDHDYHTRGGAADGRFRTDTHNLDKIEVGGMPDDDPTGEAPRVDYRPEPEGELEVIEADEASLDSPVVKFGAPVLTHGDAIAKVEVANEVLSIVSQAFDEAHGSGRGRAALQLLVDGVPGPYASVLHNLRIDEGGELPTDQVMRNLQSRPPTEHRQLLNNGLVDLIERALSSAADDLPEESFDEVLGSVAGYRQRLGL